MKIDVANVAKLANLPLTDTEEKHFEPQLADVLEYINKLKEVNTEDVPETSQVTGLENVLAEDKTGPSLTQDEALANTPHKHKGFFVVKSVLDKP